MLLSNSRGHSVLEIIFLKQKEDKNNDRKKDKF